LAGDARRRAPSVSAHEQLNRCTVASSSFPLINQPLCRLPFEEPSPLRDSTRRRPVTSSSAHLSPSPPYKRCSKHRCSLPHLVPPKALPPRASNHITLRSNPSLFRSTVAGLSPAPHRPPSPTVGTPGAPFSFSPTTGELPLTGAARARALVSPSATTTSGPPWTRRRPLGHSPPDHAPGPPAFFFTKINP
jgi:hypothetical protein